MGKLRVIVSSGDICIQWDTAEEEAVKEAERLFEEARRCGATAIELRPDGTGQVVDKLNPKTDTIMVPRIAGGHQ